MNPDGMNGGGGPKSAPRRILAPRACYECRRKKTRCDMRQPTCSLCHRIGFECIYPTTRIVGTRSHRDSDSNSMTTNHPSDDNMSKSQQQRHPQYLESEFRHLPVDGISSTSNTSTPYIQLTNADIALSDASGDMSNSLYADLMSTPLQQNLQEPDPLIRAPSIWEQLLEDQNHMSWVDLDPFSQTTQNSHHTPGSAYSFQGNLSGSDSLTLPQTGRANDPLHSDNQKQLADNALLSIDVTETVADHLIDLFFERVQCFLPLLHRRNIYLEFQGSNYKNLDFESALLLNGMFALSARFSQWPELQTTAPKERGYRFHQKGKVLCSHYLNDDYQPSLRILQGYILLTNYELISKPSFQGWIGTGVCCRMAYGLSLHQIDLKYTQSLEAENMNEVLWVEKEEKRRAWWSVFSMDCFLSTISSRPFNLDMNRMDVLLPISDQDWFAGHDIPSARLPSGGPSVIWKSLEGCENQNPYAWFLVCEALLRASNEEFNVEDPSPDDLKILQSALHCFALSLPPNFSLSGANVTFDDQNFADKNWSICTLLLLHSAHIFVALKLEVRDVFSRVNGATDTPQTRSGSGSSSKGIGPCDCGKVVETCAHHISEKLRAMKVWSPDFIPVANPMIACAVAGLKSPQPRHGCVNNSTTLLLQLDEQLRNLTLGRISQYWGLGTFMQEFLNDSSSTATKIQDKAKITWIQGLTFLRNRSSVVS